MESATKSQLDLLKERIEYDENVFGEEISYYGFTDSEDNIIYTLNKNPKVGDMTYLYVEEKMEENKTIESVSELSAIVGSITVDNVVYNSTSIIVKICKTYIDVLNRLLEDSKYIALSLRFPYEDYSNIELPNKYKNWQLRCCEEIYQGIGTQGIKSYSENGLSWTRDSGYISYELRGEIEPLVGYIKVGDIDVQTQE